MARSDHFKGDGYKIPKLSTLTKDLRAAFGKRGDRTLYAGLTVRAGGWCLSLAYGRDGEALDEHLDDYRIDKRYAVASALLVKDPGEASTILLTSIWRALDGDHPKKAHAAATRALAA